jgi:hypothetical protein
MLHNYNFKVTVFFFFNFKKRLIINKNIKELNVNYKHMKKHYEF